MSDLHQLIVIGGGAGGLELVARLARKNLKKYNIQLTLIDNTLKHIWKPLLHEVATGFSPSWPEDQLDYLTYSYEQGFQFIYGELISLDRETNTLTLAAMFDNTGVEILPIRKIHYDTLVLSLGSKANDFNIPGVNEFCLFLDNLRQAEVLNQLFTVQLIKRMQHPDYGAEKIVIVIIGGGATGVELAAEIYRAFNLAMRIARKSVNIYSYIEIKIVEAADRIVSTLPVNVSRKVTLHLESLKIEVLTNKRVIEVNGDGVRLADGTYIKAQIRLWCAGIKADTLLSHLDGLETNKTNQLIVKQTLQTSTDSLIFAFGDCASCPQHAPHSAIHYVPPRAQAAHQQAKFLARQLLLHIRGKHTAQYHYKDWGSLISIGNQYAVGTLMHIFIKRITLSGMTARLVYWLLYKSHQICLWSFWRVFIYTISHWLAMDFKNRLKLH